MTFSPEDEERFIAAYAAEPGSLMIAVFDGDILVGYANLSAVFDRKKTRHRATFGVALLRREWGQGLGEKLLTELVAFAKAAGYEQLELEVAAANVPAVSLYRKLGFREYGRRPQSLKLKSGGYVEELLMLLEL